MMYLIINLIYINIKMNKDIKSKKNPNKKIIKIK